MDIAQLRVFVAVADELHFGRAAERLHLAQPPVSRSVRSLEESLGVLLFDRSTRKVELTPAGKALLDPAREVLAATERARRAVAAVAAGESGDVRIAFASASTQQFVSGMISDLRARAPGVAVSLTGLAYGSKALDLLATDEADIVFGRWERVPPALASALVTREEFVLAVPSRHVFAARSSVAWADLAGMPLVTLPEDSLLVQLSRRAAEIAGFVPNIVQVAPDTSTVIALVRAGVGCSPTVSSVPAGVSHDGVEFVRLSPATSVHMSMAWRRNEAKPAVIATIDQVRHAIRDESISPRA